MKSKYVSAGKASMALLISTVLTSCLAQLLIASPALAECTYEGQTYQTGDTVGSYVCMPDGNWQPQ